MSETATPDFHLRERIISEPEVILEDRDLMRALVGANEKAMGNNVVDLRGIAMDRLQHRLDRLEDTHRSVIAAAYENLAGTNQIHRAVLALLTPTEFEEFLDVLNSELADTLRVSKVRLILESTQAANDPNLKKISHVLAVATPGYVDSYMADGARSADSKVVLRGVPAGNRFVYEDAAAEIRSEALMKLDLSGGRLPGMLALGTDKPDQFSPSQGTDLLIFLANVLERALRRWLA